MPAEYRIDAARRIVFSAASGILTGDELRSHQARLAADPAFQPDMDQIADFTAVERVGLGPPEIAQLVDGNPFRAGSRRAIVVNQPLPYGLARMFQTMTESHGPEIRIFENAADARRWLGLEE